MNFNRNNPKIQIKVFGLKIEGKKKEKKLGVPVSLAFLNF